MPKEIIKTERAPNAIGPYSQAIRSGNFVFVSGQLPINPATGAISGDIFVQTRQAIENIDAILSSINGASVRNVVKTTVFLKHLNDFLSMNTVYQEYFPQNAPARSCIEVSNIPKDALIEIEAIAIIDHDKSGEV